MNKFYFLAIFVFTAYVIGTKPNFLFAEENASLFVIGGGYMDAKCYSGGLIQVGYKYKNYIWSCLRPQVTLLLTSFCSSYIGFGMGCELYLTKKIIVIPSFSPGLYWKGKGKDLGSPIEFQSALEIAYEIENKARLGIQIFHISNAHLSHRNPGFNAAILCLSIVK